MKKLSTAVAGIAFFLLGIFGTKAPAANAAIFSVDDSGSWITGTNQLSKLGFDMVTVSNDSSVTEGTPIDAISSPFGQLAFSPQVRKAYIGGNHLWATWSNGYTGEVYDNLGVIATTIALPQGISAFDLYVEPNFFGQDYDIAVTAKDGATATLSQLVSGTFGAKYFGFYATAGDMLSTITVIDRSGITDNGFAVGQLRLAAKTVKSVPELTSTWGLLAFGALSTSGLSRRKQKADRT